jgi:phosphoserine phosphatase
MTHYWPIHVSPAASLYGTLLFIPSPKHAPPASPTGIPELVSVLRMAGKRVYLVSGGFRQIIHPLASSLEIPLDHVFANTILFDVRRT